MNITALVSPLLALIAAPLLPGLINRAKAVLAGRRGAPILQLYYDLRKLLGKGEVLSRTSGWVFRLGPIIGLAAVMMTLLIMPFGPLPAMFSFNGDFIFFAYLLALKRFCTVLAALDTGSSFEGMGASREVFFSALAEPALLLGLAGLSRLTGSLSISEMIEKLASQPGMVASPAVLLIVIAVTLVFLAENARIPIDDPTTHLELTMIHEVMILDHSGPALAFIEYGAALQLWVLGVFIADILTPLRPDFWLSITACAAAMAVLAVVVGLIESSMARLRLIRVPQLLISASVFASLAIFLGLQ
ncbi:MAG: NADH-quinone oxidoreductase subunit H [Deltaproteobacteria bacterium]